MTASAESAWLTDLAALLSNLEYRPAEAPDSDIPFADALQSIVSATWTAELTESAHAARLTHSAITALRRSLLVQLSDLMARPLGHQFSAGRTLADVVMSHLVDRLSPGARKSRYERFCRNQVDAGFDLLLEEFPVLGRLMATVIRNWSLAAVELLARVTTDRALIERRFSVPESAQITRVETGLGDSHRGGRGVAVLTFEPGVRLVYKPRPVDIEASYHDFMRTVSTALFEEPLRTLEVAACGSYGYVEYLEYQPVRDPKELPRFYRSAGRTLGLLYVLGATDCHWENMIASADQLVLVDAETLLEGTPFPTDEKAAADQSLATDRMTHSILRTGMLPAWISIGPARAIDISALGAQIHQGRVLRATWCFVNSDDMVWGEREVDARHPNCSPLGPGLTNRLVDFADELASGLEETLTTLRAPVNQQLARTCIDKFRGASRRVVVRPTRTYVLLQEEATQPEALRDPDERGIRLDKLSRAYIGGQEKPRTWPLLLPELTDMEALDVPYFESFAGSTVLRCGNHVVDSNYYEKEGLAESIRRLDGLSDADIRWQIRLLHSAIAAHRFEMAGGDSDTSILSDAVRTAPVAGDAMSIARLMLDDTIEDPSGPPTWLTVSLMADATRVQLGLVPAGLYDGRAGIAAFLYDCGEAAVGDAVMAPVLDAITDHEVARVQRYLRTIGFGLSGGSGILRLMEHLIARELRSQQWHDLSAKLLTFITNEALAADKSSDLVSGIAGLAGPAAAAHARAPGDDTARVLHQVGRLLVERQDESGGWPMGAGLPALAGLSHGASGIAVALAEIAVALGNDEFAAAAARGVAFEAELFDIETKNWPDLRRGIPPESRFLMRSWCHGATGVALARVRLIELLDTHPDVGRWHDELRLALDGVMESEPITVDHLCCGNFGRAAVLSFAGSVLSEPRWQVASMELTASVGREVDNQPERYRLLLGIVGETGLRLPGLMSGLAGVGMHLLHGQNTDWVRRLLI